MPSHYVYHLYVYHLRTHDNSRQSFDAQSYYLPNSYVDVPISKNQSQSFDTHESDIMIQLSLVVTVLQPHDDNSYSVTELILINLIIVLPCNLISYTGCMYVESFTSYNLVFALSKVYPCLYSCRFH